MSIASHPDRAIAPPSGAPLPRTARLLKASEFKQVFKNNQASSDGLFRVLWRINDGRTHRLGMAVSRKVDRRAVGRNRIKRIIRERFRHWRATQVGAERCFDVVVIPRPRAAQDDNASLGRSLDRLWQRVGRTRADIDRAPRATRKVN
ncbi:MAG: ribonuclease P protein component [Xanthomonadales bacterium]